MLEAVRRDGPGLLALVALALALHGYHFGVDDQTLYVPALLKHLDPTLFPHDAAFFLTEARYTAFDELIAILIRVTRLPLDVLFFGMYVTALLMVLRACQLLVRLCFADRAAQWTGLAAIVILLPFPVAGTRLALMEWYFHPRGPAIALMLFAFLAGTAGQWRRAVPLMTMAAVFHPLTALWGVGHVLFQAGFWKWRAATVAALTIGLAACVAPSPPRWETEYWRNALSPAYFDVRYPINWPWYEWAGVIVPLAILTGLAWDARRHANVAMARIVSRLFMSGMFGVIVALIVTASPDRRLPLQPMRELQIMYFVTVLLLAAWIERYVLRGRLWRRATFFVPITVAVLVAQPSFPSSPHVEWPGSTSRNPWAEAFEWVRLHTPKDALFALDPFHPWRTTADTHMFRALAHRSMMAQAVHDLAPAAMSPELGARWTRESTALAAWPRFTATDFARLREDFGVSWVIVARPQDAGLDCPFTNADVAVCQLGTTAPPSPGLP